MSPRILLCVLLVLLLGLTVGCSKQRAPYEVKPSGFLRDYSQLEKGQDDDSKLIYINSSHDFSQYDSAIIMPVVAWEIENAPTDEAERSELRRLAKYFETAIREQMRREFQLLEEPNEGTLRVRAGLIHADETRIVVECEILDAFTGERLVAAVDQRAPGDGAEEDAARSGGRRASEADFDYWARRITSALVLFREYDGSRKSSN